MSKLGKTLKGALVGVVGTAGAVGAAQAGFGPPNFSGTDADWSGLRCDEGQGLEVDVRFDGPDNKCLEMPLEALQWVDYDPEGEWFFNERVEAYYDETSNCGSNYGNIGEIGRFTELNIMKFDLKWTEAPKGSGKPGKPNHSYPSANTIEISLRALGEAPECNVP